MVKQIDFKDEVVRAILVFPTFFPMHYNVHVGNKSWEKDDDL